MKWQSEENVGLAEAAEWARHFGQLEKDMDALLADLFGVSRDVMHSWINPGKYISGAELAGAGLAELISAADLVKPAGIFHILNPEDRNGEILPAAGKPKLRKAP